MTEQFDKIEACNISIGIYCILSKHINKLKLEYSCNLNSYGHMVINIEDKFFIECASGLYKNVDAHYAFRLKGFRSFKHGYDLEGILVRLNDEIMHGEIENEK